MKVVVLGAGGRLGRRLVVAGKAAGHDVTAFVRQRSKLEAVLSPEILAGINVVEGDVAVQEELQQVLEGQDAVVNSAGYVDMGEGFTKLVQAVVRAALACRLPPKRLCVLGGAGVLPLPGRAGALAMDCLGFPAKFGPHRQNYLALKELTDSLDWCMACPGPLVDAPAGTSGDADNVAVSLDEWPVPLPNWAAVLPTRLLLPAVGMSLKQRLACSYEDVAAAIMAHLAPGPDWRHKRIGFATRS